MYRLARMLVIAATLALYGSASFFGDGLHGVLGIGHASRMESGGDDAQTVIASSDSCLVCEFHLLSQAVEDGVEPDSLEYISVCACEPSTPMARVSVLSPAQPRAPPIASASVRLI